MSHEMPPPLEWEDQQSGSTRLAIWAHDNPGQFFSFMLEYGLLSEQQWADLLRSLPDEMVTAILRIAKAHGRLEERALTDGSYLYSIRLPVTGKRKFRKSTQKTSLYQTWERELKQIEQRMASQAAFMGYVPVALLREHSLHLKAKPKVTTKQVNNVQHVVFKTKESVE